MLLLFFLLLYITVAASDIDDELAMFSNFGECVDIIAPGVDIRSACSAKLKIPGTCYMDDTKNDNVCCLNDGNGGLDYLVWSGTSMATPHVAGVLAQLLERYPNASSSQIKTYLTCTAAKDFIKLDTAIVKKGLRDTITPNLLLQVSNQSNFDTPANPNLCAEGLGCLNSCSNKGKCLREFSEIFFPETADLECHCEVGRGGPDCSTTVNFNKCPSGTKKATVYFEEEDVADYWSVSAYSITPLIIGAGANSTLDVTEIVDYALDSTSPYKQFITRNYCVAPGCYYLNLASGYDPKEVGWCINGICGGLPNDSTLKGTLKQIPWCIDSGGVVTMKCSSLFVPTTVELKNTKSNGWSGAHYEFKDAAGEVLYGGYLDSSKRRRLHGLCVPKSGVSKLRFSALPTDKQQMSSISMVILGNIATPRGAPLNIYVGSDGIAQVLTPPPTRTPTVSPTFSQAPTSASEKSSSTSRNNKEYYKYLYILLILIPIFLYLCFIIWRQNKTKKEIQAGNKDVSSADGVVGARAVVPLSDDYNGTDNNALSCDEKNENRRLPSSTLPI